MQPLFKFVLAHEATGEYELKYAPVGWDDMQQTFARDALYHGVTTKYTLDFNFVKDGYAFIRTVFNTFGIEADILLIIYELNKNTSKYFASYTGQLNLSGYAATETDCTVNAENTGFTQRLLNLDEVSIDLTKLVSVDGLPIKPFNKELCQIALHSKATVKGYEANATQNQPEFDYRPVTREDETSATIFVGYDTEVKNEFSAYSYTTGLNFSKESLPIIEFIEDGEITVEFALDFHIECRKSQGDFKTGEVDFFIGVGLNGPPVNKIPVPNERIFSYNQSGLHSFLTKDVKVSGSRTYNVKAGEALYFFGYAGVFDTSSPTIGTFEFEWVMELTGFNSIKVSGVTTTPQTPANGLLAHEAATRILQGLTGRNDVLYSEILGRTDSEPVSYKKDGELSFLWLTNGSQIRGFPMYDTVYTAPLWDANKLYATGEKVSLPNDTSTYTATASNKGESPTLLQSWEATSTKPISVTGRPIFATWKEYVEALNAIRPVGCGIELTPNGSERVRLEGVEHFYQNMIILQLGKVADLKLSVATEYYYNQVEIGYEKWGSNQDNSLDEVATKQTRIPPILKEKNKYTALSKYSASGYLIEDLRRQQYVNTPEKENSDDKTNFWVCVLKKGLLGVTYYETERNQNLTICNNVLSPSTIYNARIWPFRNFMRHGAIIRAGLQFLDKKPVAFGEGNANYIAETRFIGEKKSVVENQSVLPTELARPFWIPEYYSFTAPLPYEQRVLIEQNPYGIISFEDSLGNEKRGFVKEIKTRLNGPDAEFKLLRANW
jgi:hypothetical protein